MNLPVSPLNLPEAKSGGFEIKHRNYTPGTKLPLVSWRTAYLTGQRPQSGVFQSGLRVHELYQKDRGVWMTDLPQELVQMTDFARTARGEVLLGGLGLGLLAHFVAEKKGVTRVDIVENSRDVARLCGRKLPHKCRLHIGDLKRFLMDMDDWPWDRAYFDTWQGTNEVTWVEIILPLRRYVAHKFGHVNLRCWAEDEMAGQVIATLQGYTMCPENVHPWKWYRAFRKAAAKIGYHFGGTRPEPGTKDYWVARTIIEQDPKHQRLIRMFITQIGLPRWEKTFGGRV